MKKNDQRPGDGTNDAETKPLPLVGKPDNKHPDDVADDKNDTLKVTVINVKRDIIDYAAFALSALLVGLLGWQLRILNRTYIADHRPRLIIRHIALLTDPDALLAADETGQLQPRAAEFAFVLNNRGATWSKIVEGNITLKSIGNEKGFSLESHMRMRGRELLPSLDKETGVPVYGEERGLLKGIKLGPDEERRIRLFAPKPRTVREATNTYMALHPERNIDAVRFFAFGYFRYSDWTGRRHTSAFCRWYEPVAGMIYAVALWCQLGEDSPIEGSDSKFYLQPDQLVTASSQSNSSLRTHGGLTMKTPGVGNTTRRC